MEDLGPSGRIVRPVPDHDSHRTGLAAVFRDLGGNRQRIGSQRLRMLLDRHGLETFLAETEDFGRNIHRCVEFEMEPAGGIDAERS